MMMMMMNAMPATGNDEQKMAMTMLMSTMNNELMKIPY